MLANIFPVLGIVLAVVVVLVLLFVGMLLWDKISYLRQSEREAEQIIRSRTTIQQPML